MTYLLKQSLLNLEQQKSIVAACHDIKLSSRNPQYPELFGTVPEPIRQTAVDIVESIGITSYNPNKVNVDFYTRKTDVYYNLLEKPMVVMAFGCQCKYLVGYAMYEVEELILTPGSLLVIYPAPDACLKIYYGIGQVQNESLINSANSIPFSNPGTTIVTVQYLDKTLFDLLG